MLDLIDRSSQVFQCSRNSSRFWLIFLVGESVPLHGTVDSTDENFLETACIGMAGTHCVSGTAIGVVIETGDRTVFGRVSNSRFCRKYMLILAQIAKLTSAPKKGLTPLQKELLYFVLLICSVMLTSIIVVIVVWYVPKSLARRTAC